MNDQNKGGSFLKGPLALFSRKGLETEKEKFDFSMLDSTHAHRKRTEQKKETFMQLLGSSIVRYYIQQYGSLDFRDQCGEDDE